MHDRAGSHTGEAAGSATDGRCAVGSPTGTAAGHAVLRRAFDGGRPATRRVSMPGGEALLTLPDVGGVWT